MTSRLNDPTMRLPRPEVDTSWHLNAACRGAADPDLWYPEAEYSWQVDYTAARTICGACPMRQRCLDDALDTGDAYGMRGGLTPNERRDLLSGRKTPRTGRTGLLSPAQIARAEKWKARGESWAQIGSWLGVSEQTAQRSVRRARRRAEAVAA